MEGVQGPDWEAPLSCKSVMHGAIIEARFGPLPGHRELRADSLRIWKEQFLKSNFRQQGNEVDHHISDQNCLCLQIVVLEK